MQLALANAGKRVNTAVYVLVGKPVSRAVAHKNNQAGNSLVYQLLFLFRQKLTWQIPCNCIYLLGYGILHTDINEIWC